MDKPKLIAEELILLQVVQDENKTGTISNESLAKILNTSTVEGKSFFITFQHLKIPNFCLEI